LYRETIPGPHFAILKRLMAKTPHGGFVVTSNVDGQFQKAGFSHDRLVEVHGSIHHLQAVDGTGPIVPVDPLLNVELEPDTFRAKPPLPVMPTGAAARPNILMFGDYWWIDARTNKQYDGLRCWLRELQKQSVTRVVVLDIGSGTAVPTARLAAANMVESFTNGVLIRINPREPELDHLPGAVSPERGITFAEGALSVMRDIESLI
jgi:NAD-dependent SIR2 family protein deacetylase